MHIIMIFILKNEEMTQIKKMIIIRFRSENNLKNYCCWSCTIGDDDGRNKRNRYYNAPLCYQRN